MPGVVFLIVIPTINFERELLFGQHQTNLDDDKNDFSSIPAQMQQHNFLPQKQLQISSSGNIVNNGSNGANGSGVDANNLNINLPDNNNAILRLEVELRDKNAPKHRRGRGGGVASRGGGGGNGSRIPINGVDLKARTAHIDGQMDSTNTMVPMEKVLEELLYKLEIEHITWTNDKKGYYHHVIFPIPSGEPCETTLHCLTELGIGKKLNSSVSVLPCSVSYDSISDGAVNKNEYQSEDAGDEQLSKWNNFVESIKSKLTVKQVVDGVRAGGSLSFDYLLLIVTADSLAALGLVENNAPNIVAAMLVSPLMGPVMSITFGAIISDRELMKSGFISLGLGMFISMLFGFIFGLILGTTEMPWGFNDWPTEEMRGRGNARSLWMGVLWALTSGTGVAVALLQGSAGPLIGVAISASLLPPVVNCGLFWALACIWLIYPNIKIPHLRGELYSGNSTYPFIYTNYLPTEFLINGIVSGLLTVVNVICIFITAIIVLKIKEVSAPYTASPDLKRFWETDLRIARKTNRSTIRQRKTFIQKDLPYQGLKEQRNRELETVIEQAINEASDDVTLNKVKRMSYSGNAAGELIRRLPLLNADKNNISAGGGSGLTSNLNVDVKTLDKLVSSLLEEKQQFGPHRIDNTKRKLEVGIDNPKGSIKLNRFRTLSHSIASGRRADSIKSIKSDTIASTMTSNGGNTDDNDNTTNNLNNLNNSGMPTIMEQQNYKVRNSSSSLSNSMKVKNVLNAITNMPKRISQNAQQQQQQNEENINLTQNIME